MPGETHVGEILAIAVGGLAWFIGGFTPLVISLIMLMLIDWVIGGLKALKLKKFSPSLFIWGIANKVVGILVIAAFHFMEQALNVNIPLKEIGATVLLINEGLSFLKNASVFVTGLEPFVKYFEVVKINVLKIFTIDESEQVSEVKED